MRALCVLGACAAAACLEAVRRRFGHKVASNAHHAVAVPLAVRALMTLPEPRALTTNRASWCSVSLASGFFAYDVAACLRSPVMLMHAVVGGTPFWHGVATGRLHHTTVAHILWEASTPFVHYRERLSRLGKRDTALYKANGLAMIASFLAFRIVGGGLMFRSGLRQVAACPGAVPAPAVLALKAACVTLNALNAYWFSKMVRGGITVFCGGREAAKGAG